MSNPDGGTWLPDYPTVEGYPHTGMSIGYRSDGTPGSTYASSENIKYWTSINEQDRVGFFMQTAASNPLESLAPNIDALNYVIVLRNGSGATAGIHDQAPSYEFYMILDNDPFVTRTLHQSSI